MQGTEYTLDLSFDLSKVNFQTLKDNGVDSVEDLLVKLDKQPEETFKSEVEKNEDILIIQYYLVVFLT